MSHMYNERAHRWVPRGTQRGDALIVNGEPMVAFGTDRGDGPCMSPCDPIERDSTGMFIKLLVSLFTSGQSFKVKVNANQPIRLGAPLYLTDSYASPMPGQVVLSTDSNSGSPWGVVFAFGQRINPGWEDALRESDVGMGTVDAIMLPPSFGVVSPPVTPPPVPAPQPTHFETTIDITSGQIVYVDHPAMTNRVVQVFLQGSPSTNNLAPTWSVYDPEDFTSHDTALNDGDYETFVYNNNNVGSQGKWYGFDAGVPVNVREFVIYDWLVNGNYRASSFAIDSSSDGMNWTNQINISDHQYAPPPNGRRVELPNAVTARYWRVRCLSSEHPDYWILTEVEAFNGAGMQRQAIVGQDIQIYLDGSSRTGIQNITPSPMQQAKVVIYEG